MSHHIEIFCQADTHHARCVWDKNCVPCVIGRNGYSTQKREGDGKTPLGTFPIRRLWIRHDRIIPPPPTTFDIRPITPQCGWADDPADAAYNRHICLPHHYHSEHLYRDDHLYDIFFELGINDAPPYANKGSALFLHLAREDFAATEGCIALAHSDMMHLVATLVAPAKITIYAP